MPSYRELLNQGKRLLQAENIENSEGDARSLMEYVWGIDRSYYFLHADDIIEDSDKLENYLDLLQKRSQHVPLQQLTGEAWFMGFPMKVNEHVLIPRWDTEVLAETALERLKKGDHLLDLCTGSACLAISLKLLGEDLVVDASDISQEALIIAGANAEANHAKIRLLQSDLFEEIPDKYDMIISNPPYIRRDVIPTLTEEVRCHEPHLALDGGEDGLDFYRSIMIQAPRHLKDGGWLGFEIGYDQGAALKGLLSEDIWTDVTVIKDLAGLDRVVWARYVYRRKDHV